MMNRRIYLLPLVALATVSWVAFGGLPVEDDERPALRTLPPSPSPAVVTEASASGSAAAAAGGSASEQEAAKVGEAVGGSSDGSSRLRLPYPSERNVPGGACGADDLSTHKLTSFPFWGKTYNVTSSCPTSGMNNQMQMMMFYHHCKRAHGKPILKWRDVSCSPTGGVQKGGGQYAVGSSSYTYTWFRWSSLFNVSQGAICFSDTYTWSEHPWMKGCALTDASYRRYYGSPAYWEERPMFDFRDSYYHEVERWLTREGIAGKPFLAVHLRRGDYVKFCREISKNYKKLRLAHWKWASKQGTRDVYSRHMDTCFPDRAKVVAGINKLLELHGLEHVVMATTDKDYLPGSEDFAKDIHGKLHAFDASRYDMTKAAYTATDSILLARATHKLLNRYSTLSLTGIDLSVVRGWFNNETTWFW